MGLLVSGEKLCLGVDIVSKISVYGCMDKGVRGKRLVHVSQRKEDLFKTFVKDWA